MSENLGPALIDAEGSRHELTLRDYRLIVSLAANAGIRVAPSEAANADAVITTGQAADILGVSRRTVTRMLDRGEIPGIRLGLNHHRSVRLGDVLAFKKRGTAGQEA